MHIPDGLLNSEVNTATFAVSGAVAALAVWRANKTLGEKQAPLLGVTAAFVFAAQMLNFPVAGGTSGHFLGALLTAVLLGPLNAVLVMAVVLVIQCLVFNDGGLSALGSNIFNMGVVGGLGGYCVFGALKTVLPKTKGALLGCAAVAGWFSVVMASVAASFELAYFGTSAIPIKIVLPAMAGVHALIGVGEALITSVVLSAVIAARPDLIRAWPRVQEGMMRRLWPFIIAALAVALALAAFVGPFASKAPDGLERIAADKGLSANEVAAKGAPLADYQVPFARDKRVATGVAGAIGTLIVFVAGFGLAKLAARRKEAA